MYTNMTKNSGVMKPGEDNNCPEKIGISGSTLKLIAIITMLIDHIGAALLTRIIIDKGILEAIVYDANGIAGLSQEDIILYYGYRIMRLIGRIAFPIFCFLLVEGFLKTRDVKKYMLRLLGFAFLSEIPFDLAFAGKIFYWEYQNVMFTLLIGVFVMMIFRWIENKGLHIGIQLILQIITLAVGMEIAYLMHTDYQAIGVFCILLFYILRDQKVWKIIAGCLAFAWEITAPLAFVPIAFYNGKRGWNMKYFFYFFYPVHLLIIYLICLALGLGDISLM